MKNYLERTTGEAPKGCVKVVCANCRTSHYVTKAYADKLRREWKDYECPCCAERGGRMWREQAMKIWLDEIFARRARA